MLCSIRPLDPKISRQDWPNLTFFPSFAEQNSFSCLINSKIRAVRSGHHNFEEMMNELL